MVLSRLYDWLQRHRRLGVLSFVLITALLAGLVARLDYQEDISAFLPQGNGAAIEALQGRSGADRIFVLFQSRDASRPVGSDELEEALDDFQEQLEQADTARVLTGVLTADDMARSAETLDGLYRRIPYLLTDGDYRRMDSLLAQPGFMDRQLEHDKQLLMLPTADVLADHVTRDPLGLFAPVLARMPRPQLTFLAVTSPYGASETRRNAGLVDQLAAIGQRVMSRHADVDIHLTGGPVVAVGNAQQIRADSLVAISLSVVLIVLLLYAALRSVRNLLLIALAVGWGWLFAMAMLSLVHQQVSIIVIGISSVVVGIAVNYPLHLIAHAPHAADMRTALTEVSKPLLVGNVTTVGAFLTLVPLDSAALRDLGLFAAFLLAGTILFVLVWLPHLVTVVRRPGPTLLDRLGAVRLENRRWLVALVALLTVPLAYYSTQPSFDADLTHLNYMTDRQRADMALLQPTSDADPAAARRQTARWTEWCHRHEPLLRRQLTEAASRQGFVAGSFDGFLDLLTTSPDDGKSAVSVMLTTLTADFNYIGTACGVLVFCFLWLSFRRLRLAVIAFTPMVVGWIWILGIMALCGIQFNIVNVILATFIFGQGDDYTIFMTEGCQYEYTTGRPMLASYRSSIVLSALIMLIGIGSLVVARHPALRSLAEVTIVGMSCVVLMAWLLPPLMFKSKYVRIL